MAAAGTLYVADRPFHVPQLNPSDYTVGISQWAPGVPYTFPLHLLTGGDHLGRHPHVTSVRPVALAPGLRVTTTALSPTFHTIYLAGEGDPSINRPDLVVPLTSVRFTRRDADETAVYVTLVAPRPGSYVASGFDVGWTDGLYSGSARLPVSFEVDAIAGSTSPGASCSPFAAEPARRCSN